MPNHCSCDLIVSGPKLKRAELFRKVQKQKGFDFLQALYPIPRVFAGVHFGCATVEGKDVKVWRDGPDKKSRLIPDKTLEKWQTKYGATNSYDWCCLHYGTKWGTYDNAKPVSHADHDEYHFNSAWVPPTEGIRVVSSLYPDLTFELSYFEGGAGFQGKAKFQNGEILEDMTDTYTGDRGG